MENRHPCLDCDQRCLNQFVPEEELASIINTMEYESGENIIKQGSLIQNRFLLCNGCVKIGTTNHQGKKAIFSLLCNPEIIEKACFHSSRDRYPINAVAVTDVTVGTITIDEFDRLGEKYPRVFDYLTEQISRELDFQQEKSAMNRWGGARENLIWLITSLYHKLDHDGRNGGTLDLNMSEQDLANMLGVSRETVVIHLSSLKKKGVAKATRGSVIVLDYDGLQEVRENL